jgi:hypothetical protein
MIVSIALALNESDDIMIAIRSWGTALGFPSTWILSAIRQSKWYLDAYSVFAGIFINWCIVGVVMTFAIRLRKPVWISRLPILSIGLFVSLLIVVGIHAMDAVEGFNETVLLGSLVSFPSTGVGYAIDDTIFRISRGAFSLPNSGIYGFGVIVNWIVIGLAGEGVRKLWARWGAT